MTAAPTAASLLKAVAANKRQTDAARIADLADAEREAVVAALSGVKPNAKIDVAVLIAETRDRLAEAEARKPEAEPWRYAITLMAPAQLSTFRRLVQAGDDPDAAATEAMATPADWPDAAPAFAYADEEATSDLDRALDDLDDLDEDDEPTKPKRGPLKRVRSRREPEPPPVKAKAKRKPQPEPLRLGPRAFDEAGALGPDPTFRAWPPPWLLDPEPADDELELDDEGDDEDADDDEL